MKATAARVAALEILRTVRSGELADRALRTHTHALHERERAWVQELVFGTFRTRGRLDYALTTRIRSGLSNLEPDILDVLRLGAYQLLEMSGVPSYAAVSQSVELAKGVSGRPAASFVNGVLRALRRESAVEYPAFAADPVENLVSWGSHPRWLVERWIQRWGAATTCRLVEANNRRPDVFLRLLGLDAGEGLARLSDAGIGAEPVERVAHTLRLAAPGDVRNALARVPAMVQDPAASLVVSYAAAPEQGVLVDLCAAPGGKAVAMAGALSNGVVLASDLSPRRIQWLRENALRVGPLPLFMVVADARVPPVRNVDFALIDVPCTGTGTLRRHPDARWRIGPDDLTTLVKLQREIMRGAAQVVRPGGHLVYATCSLESEENEQQVDWFLDEHPAFENVPGGPVADCFLDEAGRLFVTPQEHGFDGAFAAKLRRRSK